MPSVKLLHFANFRKVIFWKNRTVNVFFSETVSFYIFLFQALSTCLNSFVIQALNGCTSLDPKPVGNVYHHHQSVSDMNTAFAELINKNIDIDIQSSPFIGTLGDESIDIAVQKKLDIYIRLVKDGEPSTQLVGNCNVVDGKAETIFNALMDFMQEKIDCGIKLVGLGIDGACVMSQWLLF